MRLTASGEKIAESRKETGQLPPVLLPKTRENLSLLLVHRLGQVRGKTRLMKIMFLLAMANRDRHLVPGGWGRYTFRPHLYGPYSRELSADFSELEDLHFADIQRVPVRCHGFDDKSGILQVYRLLPKGDYAATTLWDRLTSEAKSAIDGLFRFNEIDLLDLLGFVYELYPEYATHSRIKDIIGAPRIVAHRLAGDYLPTLVGLR